MKHEKVCADNKIIKAENEDLKKDVNSFNVALKTSKKENKDSSHRLERKIEQLEDNLKKLHEFQINKEFEEKDLKNKAKKIDKKLKLIQEREAKIVIDKNNFERFKSKNNNSIHIQAEDSKVIANFITDSVATSEEDFTETHEDKIDSKIKNDNSKQNILAKDDSKGIVADWEKHWRNWSKTDNG